MVWVMVVASEKYGLDPYIMAAIATKETTGGNFACPITASNEQGYPDYRHLMYSGGSCTIKLLNHMKMDLTLSLRINRKQSCYCKTLCR